MATAPHWPHGRGNIARITGGKGFVPGAPRVAVRAPVLRASDAFEMVLSRLTKVRQSGDRAIACCPAHEDRTPSMSVRRGERQPVLLHCHAGCSPDDILAAIGLDWRDVCAETTTEAIAAWRAEAQQKEVDHARLVVSIAEGEHWRGVTLPPEDAAAVERAREVVARADAEQLAADLLPPTAEEFAAVAYPPQESLIGPICSQQLVLIAATQGVGKTQMGLALADALSRGEPWCGWQCDRPRRVMYIDGEMPGAALQGRLAMYARGGARPADLRLVSAVSWVPEQPALMPLGALNLAAGEWSQTVLEWTERAQTDVLFLDNLMSLVNVPGVSMSSDEFWRPMFDVARIARGRGLAVVVYDHLNQLGLVHGTKTKLWHADLAITLRPPAGADEDDDSRPVEFEVHFDKVRNRRDEATRPFLARLMHRDKPRPDGARVEWYREDLSDFQVGQVADLSRAGMSIRDIAEELNLSRMKVQRIIKKIKDMT